MSSETTKFINEDRVIELIECYGANLDSWPEDERAAAGSIINKSAKLQQLQKEAQPLDDVMLVKNSLQSLDSRASASIVTEIIDKLPTQEAPLENERPGNKKANFDPSTWYQYLAVAAVAVMLVTTVFFVQNPLLDQPSYSDSVSQIELDQWMWLDATGVSIDENNGIDTPISFLTFIELETSQN